MKSLTSLILCFVILILISTKSLIIWSTSFPWKPTSVNFVASTLINGASDSFAILLAISVLPQPYSGDQVETKDERDGIISKGSRKIGFVSYTKRKAKEFFPITWSCCKWSTTLPLECSGWDQSKSASPISYTKILDYHSLSYKMRSYEETHPQGDRKRSRTRLSRYEWA